MKNISYAAIQIMAGIHSDHLMYMHVCEHAKESGSTVPQIAIDHAAELLKLCDESLEANHD